MARLLLYHLQPSALETLTSSSSTLFLLLCACASAAAVVCIVFSLCGTHKHSKMARDNKKRIPISRKLAAEDRKLICSLSSIMGSKAMSLTKMISWKKTAGAGADHDVDQGDSRPAEDEPAALWKKSIIMGEKCRPMDFSGQILYDTEGNRLPAPAELPESQRDGQVLTAMEKA